MDALWLSDEEALSNALWAFKHITDNKETVLTRLLTTEIIGRILALILSHSKQVSDPALECLGNISVNEDDCGLMLAGCGVMEALKKLIEASRSKSTRREQCWILSNLVACGPAVISSFIEEKMHLVIAPLLKGSNISVVKEATWVMCNCLTKGSNRQVKNLIEEGVLGELLKLLEMNDMNVRYLILDTIHKMLTEIHNAEVIFLIISQMKEETILNQVQAIKRFHKEMQMKNEELERLRRQ